MPDITYRRATPTDAEAIADVIREVVAEPNPVAFDHAWTVEEVARWLQRLGDAGAIFVALTGGQADGQVGGKVAGFGSLDFDTQAPDTATLGVWLRPAFRRRGIATTLAEYLLEHAREHGFRRIVGRLPDNNAAALSFLSSIGGLVPIINPEMRFELPL